VRFEVVRWVWDLFSIRLVKVIEEKVVQEIKELGAHPIFRKRLPAWIAEGKSVAEVRREVLHIWQLVALYRKGSQPAVSSASAIFADAASMGVAVTVSAGGVTGVGIADGIVDENDSSIVSAESCGGGGGKSYKQQFAEQAAALKPDFERWFESELRWIAEGGSLEAPAAVPSAITPEPAAVTSPPKFEALRQVFRLVREDLEAKIMRGEVEVPRLLSEVAIAGIVQNAVEIERGLRGLAEPGVDPPESEDDRVLPDPQVEEVAEAKERSEPPTLSLRQRPKARKVVDHKPARINVGALFTDARERFIAEIMVKWPELTVKEICLKADTQRRMRPAERKALCPLDSWIRQSGDKRPKPEWILDDNLWKKVYEAPDSRHNVEEWMSKRKKLLNASGL
jgi:hypothetical protein